MYSKLNNREGIEESKRDISLGRKDFENEIKELSNEEYAIIFIYFVYSSDSDSDSSVADEGNHASLIPSFLK